MLKGSAPDINFIFLFIHWHWNLCKVSVIFCLYIFLYSIDIIHSLFHLFIDTRCHITILFCYIRCISFYFQLTYQDLLFSNVMTLFLALLFLLFIIFIFSSSILVYPPLLHVSSLYLFYLLYYDLFLFLLYLYHSPNLLLSN